MKVTKIETLRCDAGWRTFSFLKVMTDEGLVGWSEYNESFGSAGLSQVIEALAPMRQTRGRQSNRSAKASAGDARSKSGDR